MTTKSAKKSNPKTKSLKVERIFDASPETLWSYWTDPVKYAKWFNPAPGMDLVVHEYDVRAGGRVRFDMPQPDGNRNPQEGVFHVVKPYREIVSGAPDKSFLIAVKFAAVGKRTRMTVTVTGIPQEYREDATKGWNAGFDKLGGLLAGSSGGKGFRIERFFAAPLSRVWALWTAKAGLESWWGPEGFTTEFHVLDLRPGGAFEYTMTATGHKQVEALRSMGVPLTSRGHGTYAEVVPETRLGIRNVVDFVPDVEPYAREDTVEFLAVRGGTKMVFTSTGMHSEQWQQMAIQGFASSLDRLEAFMRNGSAPKGSGHPMKVTLPNDREVRVTRILDAPRERVYRAYTDPRAIPKWWGPRYLTTTVDAMDVRPGGAWRYVQVAPDGTVHAFRGEYREVVPLKRIARTFEYEPQAGHIVLETTTFEDASRGKTKVTVSAVFASREDRDGMIASGMESGMREGYERLDELLAGEA